MLVFASLRFQRLAPFRSLLSAACAVSVSSFSAAFSVSVVVFSGLRRFGLVVFSGLRRFGPCCQRFAPFRFLRFQQLTLFRSCSAF
jgi:hypothetical protein